MKSHGLRQVDLAKLCGVTQGAVSGWEKGVIPKGDALFHAANAFGVSMEYLLTGDGGEPPSLMLSEKSASYGPDIVQARQAAREARLALEKLEKILG